MKLIVTRTPLSANGVDGIELAIVIIATFGQAVSSQGPVLNIVSILIVWRFIVSISDFPNVCRNTEYGPTSWEWALEGTIP